MVLRQLCNFTNVYDDHFVNVKRQNNDRIKLWVFSGGIRRYENLGASSN